MTMRFREGQVVAQRYKVINLIGEGSGGEVYKVWDNKRSTHLALKLLKPEWNSNPKLIASFLDEAKSLANLQHPNIVRFYELVTDEDLTFFLMDYVDGITLRTILKESSTPLSLDKILSIITPICRALHYAHQQKVIHCDVKPENILIDRNGLVFLTDFGIALHRGCGSNILGIAGTPTYMAPEQINGVGISPQTDVYALGVLLYELFTLVKPFQGKTGSTQSSTNDRIRWEHVHIFPVAPNQVNSRIGKDLSEVILTCLSKNPYQRYPGTIELLDALEKLQIEKPNIPVEIKKEEPVSREPVLERRKATFPILLAVIMVAIIVSLFLLMGRPAGNLLPSQEIQPDVFYDENACMDVDLRPLAEAILEECVTGINVNSDGKIQVHFRWELIGSQQNLAVNIAADSNNYNMYIMDNLGNRLNHISTGGGTNQDVTLKAGDYKEGWFFFPSLSPDADGFYFVDDDNQVITDLLERKW